MSTSNGRPRPPALAGSGLKEHPAAVRGFDKLLALVTIEALYQIGLRATHPLSICQHRKLFIAAMALIRFPAWVTLSQ